MLINLDGKFFDLLFDGGIFTDMSSFFYQVYDVDYCVFET